jgi:pimeloyl-ACP methyl ester carboxylesterase
MTDRCIRHVLRARDGTQIAYHSHLGTQASEEALAFRPTVLLTNGVGTSENFWRFLVHDLEGDHRVVHWNYRGHGSSGSPQGGDYSLEAHVEDLARVTLAVMARGDGRPPHHVGFSMGVRVVLELYRRHPELVPSMTLIGGTARPPGMGTLLLAAPGALTATRLSMDALTPLVPVLAPAVHALLASPLAVPAARALRLLRPRAGRADVDMLVTALRQMDPRAFWLSVRSLLEGDSSDVLPTVSVPVQVIAAAQDVMVPLGEMERLHAAIPGARFIRVEDAGHAGLVEAGVDMARALRAFLRELGAGEEEGLAAPRGAAAPPAPPRLAGSGGAVVLPLRPDEGGGAPTLH